MPIRLFLFGIALAVLLPILGCGGGNEPVNKDRDMPKPPTKDKNK